MGAHICQALLPLAQQHPARAALACGERTVTGAELFQRVAAGSAALRDALGVCPGDRVAIVAHNSEWYIEVLLAATAAGSIATLINWRWSETEACAAVDRVGATILVHDAECGPLAAALVARCPVRATDSSESVTESVTESLTESVPQSLRAAVAVGGPAAADRLGPSRGDCHGEWDWAWEALLAAAAPSGAAALADGRLPLSWAPDGCALTPCALSPGSKLSAFPSVAVVVFTSGSTGRPKAAMLTHGALVFQSLAKMAVVGYCASDVFVHSSPLFHVGGLSSALATLQARGMGVLLPRFTAASFARVASRHSATATMALPAMLADLAAASEDESSHAATIRFPLVRLLLVGGAPLPPGLHARSAKIFPNARHVMAYGMTEAASTLAFWPLDAPGDGAAAGGKTRENSGKFGGDCAGWPCPHFEIRISAEGGGGEGGEVLARGPAVMRGYWGDSAATAAAFADSRITDSGNDSVRDSSPWLRTGDRGRLDAAGCLWLLGRLRDVIRSGGESVPCAAVETALASHPGVAAVAACAVPDGRLGEAVAVAVVLSPGWAWDSSPGLDHGLDHGLESQRVGLASLRAHGRSAGLSGFMLPRVATAMGGLPLTAGGKLARAALPEVLAAARPPNLVSRL